MYLIYSGEVSIKKDISLQDPNEDERHKIKKRMTLISKIGKY